MCESKLVSHVIGSTVHAPPAGKKGQGGQIVKQESILGYVSKIEMGESVRHRL